VSAATLPIDFAAPRHTRLAVALGLLAVLLALSIGLAWWNGEQHLRVLRAEAAKAERLARTASRPAPVRLTPDRARAVNDAVIRLNTPWERLFAVLSAAADRTRPRALALLALEPESAVQAVKITAEARSVEAMLSYQRALQSNPDVQSAVLTRHEVPADETVGVVRFWIELRLAPQPEARP